MASKQKGPPRYEEPGGEPIALKGGPALGCVHDFTVTVTGEKDITPISGKGPCDYDDKEADAAYAQALGRLEKSVARECGGDCPDKNTQTCSGSVTDTSTTYTTRREEEGNKRCFVVCTIVGKGKCGCVARA